MHNGIFRQIMGNDLCCRAGMIRYIYGIVVFWLDAKQLRHWHYIGMLRIKIRIVQLRAIRRQWNSKPHRFDTIERNTPRGDFSADQAVEIVILRPVV